MYRCSLRFTWAGPLDRRPTSCCSGEIQHRESPKSSASRFGGVASDYHALHEWFDQVKAHLPDVRHRAVLHSSFGIYLVQQVFGELIVRKSDGKEILTCILSEQHVLEDLGFIPHGARLDQGSADARVEDQGRECARGRCSLSEARAHAA